MNIQDEIVDEDSSHTEDYFDDSDDSNVEPTNESTQRNEGPAGVEGAGDVEGREEDEGAPRYVVPPRAMGAVEVPMIVANVDRATKAFGNITTYKPLLDPNRNSLPLYMDPENAFCPPILSHNASTHNVLLKVTVPKRTGRKRKRGTDGPWEGEVASDHGNAPPIVGHDGRVASEKRADHPKTLLRKLQDNSESYRVETVGVIKHTHRYRGLMDFQVDLSRSDFAANFVDKILSRDVNKIKQFKIGRDIDSGPKSDIMPPPKFTHMTLPFNYAYEQNPFVHAIKGDEGEEQVVNTTAPALVGCFIAATDPTPPAPNRLPNLLDPLTAEVITAVEEAFEARPIWTRRSLLNYLGPRLKNWGPLKRFLGYAAYQFKGGPWRDALMPYGLDPRSDPKYRIYQTLSFKLPSIKNANKNAKKKSWKNFRRARDADPYKFEEDTAESHIFNGDTYYSNGKVWQVCDITDPTLSRMFTEASIRPTCDVESSGWYHQGLWGKAKAVMKCKLVAVLFNRTLAPNAFDHLLHDAGAPAADEIELGADGEEHQQQQSQQQQQQQQLQYQRSTSLTPPPGAIVSLRLPDLQLTNEEVRFLKGRRIRSTGRRKTEKKKFMSVQLSRRPNRPSAVPKPRGGVVVMGNETPASETDTLGQVGEKGDQTSRIHGQGGDQSGEGHSRIDDVYDEMDVEDDEEMDEVDEGGEEDVEEEEEYDEEEGQAETYEDPYAYLDDDDGVEYIYDD
ncbi:hypothetical protein jhhlp_008679 [Lomentospora prolificans]|uniref:Transcription factor IIIC subunit 5 HTH domain-containing protein n=1 Tax=Lomentospora prolificans TaxID=41688 RepID=A0A2N3MYQ0_9PEZI|nr:hypothetical protein jhhlp_008679 [Lomentospora prolificans]